VFLLFASVLAFLAYQQIWHDAKGKGPVTVPTKPKVQAKTRRAKTK